MENPYTEQAVQTLTAKGCKVYRAAGEAQVEEILQNICNSGEEALISTDAFLHSLHVKEMLNHVGLAWTCTDDLQREDKQSMLEAANTAQWGITGATGICAATGTLVVGESKGDARIVSNIPREHIAIVSEQAIYADGTAVLNETPKQPYYTFITGPSRTGDIEGNFVLGMHGPLAVHVIIVGD